MDYKTALITGASSGIGRGLALALARRGTHVVAAARRKEQLDALAAESPNIEPLVLDVSDCDRTHDTVRALDEKLQLDLVIANAGVGAPTRAQSLEWKTVKHIFDVNVMGATATLAGALPGMVARNRGHIAGVSSVAAFRGLPRFAAYCSSKALLSTFLESLRVDLRKSGVAVTTVHPGYVRTEMTAKNKFRMPFIVELDDAVATILGALDRRDGDCSFPLPVVAALRTARALPSPLYRFLITKTPRNLGR